MHAWGEVDASTKSQSNAFWNFLIYHISIPERYTVDTPNSVISNPNRCSYIWNQTKIKCSLTLQFKWIRIGWTSCLVIFTNIHRSKRVHVDTPTNVTELNWNRVLQPTYVCGLDFIRIDLDHNRVWCVHNWVLTESTRINPDRGLVCQRYYTNLRMWCFDVEIGNWKMIFT